MSLEQLRDRMQALRVERGSHGQAMIVVRRGDSPRGRRQFTGTVRIDHRAIGYLVGNEPRVFNVEPGEHTITVYLGRRDRVEGVPGRAEVSSTIALGPGEEASFACGVRREVVRPWARMRTAGGRRGMVLAIAVYLCGAAGWIIAPILQRVVAAVVGYYLSAIPRGIRWPIPLIVSPIPASFCAAILGGYLFGRWIPGVSQEFAEGLLPRIGSPYYLEQQHRGAPKVT